jgi:hypothetical protein
MRGACRAADLFSPRPTTAPTAVVYFICPAASSPQPRTPLQQARPQGTTSKVSGCDGYGRCFEKNGIAYVVSTVARNATTTLDILKSWRFSEQAPPCEIQVFPVSNT